MLELDKSFIILLINFLFLLFILNNILFKPILKIFRERSDTVNNNLSSAKDMTSKKNEIISVLNKELLDSRIKAKEIFESFRANGANAQKETLSKARAEASEMLDRAKTELKKAGENARQSIRSEIDRLSDEITKKLLKA